MNRFIDTKLPFISLSIALLKYSKNDGVYRLEMKSIGKWFLP